MSKGGQGFALARLLTLGRGVVCISEKSRDMAYCLLYAETQKDPSNARVGLADRSYPESERDRGCPRPSPAQRVHFATLDMKGLQQLETENCRIK
jgi:hypothetical protein